VQERLLEDLEEDERKSVLDEGWEWFSRFAALARPDLGTRDDPFGELRPANTTSGPPVLDLALSPAPEDRQPTR
jgi:hypothetical protein